jgi:hypothetical protein
MELPMHQGEMLIGLSRQSRVRRAQDCQKSPADSCSGKEKTIEPFHARCCFWARLGEGRTRLGRHVSSTSADDTVPASGGMAVCGLLQIAKIGCSIIPVCGQPLRDWREAGAISRGAKLCAISLTATGFAYFIVRSGPSPLVAIVVAAIVLAVGVFIVSRPELWK